MLSFEHSPVDHLKKIQLKTLIQDSLAVRAGLFFFQPEPVPSAAGAPEVPQSSQKADTKLNPRT